MPPSPQMGTCKTLNESSRRLKPNLGAGPFGKLYSNRGNPTFSIDREPLECWRAEFSRSLMARGLWDSRIWCQLLPRKWYHELLKFQKTKLYFSFLLKKNKQSWEQERYSFLDSLSFPSTPPNSNQSLIIRCSNDWVRLSLGVAKDVPLYSVHIRPN